MSRSSKSIRANDIFPKRLNLASRRPCQIADSDIPRQYSKLISFEECRIQGAASCETLCAFAADMKAAGLMWAPKVFDFVRDSGKVIFYLAPYSSF
ncbi:MAG: hypothetical protein ACLFRF_08660, partial [Desulfobacterales bacterium]